MCRVAAISGLVAFVLLQQAQPSPPQPAPPATEVYLADFTDDTIPPVGRPKNISNNPGYDNQPSFLPDGSGLLFTSNRDGKQTDIYRYDLTTGITQLTRTPESEYSPIATPDRKSFSVIRVEADGTQRLWRFDLDGSNPRLVLENVKPVGYHVWIDDTRLALFVLGGQGQPNTLQLADTKTGKSDVIESGIGRSLLIRPDKGTVSFVHKPAGGHWIVRELDPRNRAIETITETVDNNVSEDCAWQPGGRLLMASGTKVFSWVPGRSNNWQEIADLSSAGIGRITRLALSPREPMKLAFVAEPPR